MIQRRCQGLGTAGGNTYGTVSLAMLIDLDNVSVIARAEINPGAMTAQGGLPQRKGHRLTLDFQPFPSENTSS